MRNLIVPVVVLFVAAAFTTALGQPPTGGSTPGGKSDTTLRDDNIRLRSVELDRIKREADKQSPDGFTAINKKIESKFTEIKEDFEGLQIAQTAVVTAYTTGKTIDYKLIASSSKDINKHARRLDSNLFSSKFELEEKKPEDGKVQPKPAIRDLIVELDNAIGSFVTSKLFTNLRVFDQPVAKQARIDLAHIIRISELLVNEAEKMP
jgi:hypothetical protein